MFKISDRYPKQVNIGINTLDTQVVLYLTIMQVTKTHIKLGYIIFKNASIKQKIQINQRPHNPSVTYIKTEEYKIQNFMSPANILSSRDKHLRNFQFENLN